MLDKEISGTHQYEQIALIHSNEISFLNPYTGVLDNSFHIDTPSSENEYIMIQLHQSRA